MASLLAKILRQALKTFDRTNQAKFAANLAALKQLTEQLTYRDLYLTPHVLNDEAFLDPERAPCTFIHIFENDLVSLSVFVLRGGFSLPIHDHPMMYGLLKCISGNLRVQSFQPQAVGESGETFFCDKNVKEVVAVVEDPQIVGPNTACALLTPYERNIHEITAVDGAAAFFDILAPPYDTEIPGYGPRRCNYYARKNLMSEMGKTEILHRIRPPSSYYCDTAEVRQAVEECLAESHSVEPTSSSYGSSQ